MLTGCQPFWNSMLSPGSFNSFSVFGIQNVADACWSVNHSMNQLIQWTYTVHLTVPGMALVIKLSAGKIQLCPYMKWLMFRLKSSGCSNKLKHCHFTQRFQFSEKNLASSPPLYHVLREGLRNFPKCPSQRLQQGCRGASLVWWVTRVQETMLFLEPRDSHFLDPSGAYNTKSLCQLESHPSKEQISRMAAISWWGVSFCGNSTRFCGMNIMSTLFNNSVTTDHLITR